jgi:enoyl-CoA hydratase/carnithine racemase
LPRVVGKAKALEMILFSKRVTPREAFDIGLINQLSLPDKLLDDALALAAKLVKRPPLAAACVLKAMSAGEYEGMAQGLKVEEEGSAMVGKSKDCIEGFTAFLEKREPIFKGE